MKLLVTSLLSMCHCILLIQDPKKTGRTVLGNVEVESKRLITEACDY
jgi:hypothetical protein